MRPTVLPLFRPVVHEWIFFAGLAIIAVTLPNSNYMLSIGQFILAGNWLLEGNYREKVTRFWNNKAAIAFTSVYLIHVVSLLWSSDLNFGLKDLKIKLPILILTFVIAGSKVSGTRLKSLWLLLLFVLSVVVTTLIGIALYNPDEATSYRQLSPFISHIRFGMMIVFSIILLLWLPGKIKEQYSGRMTETQQRSLKLVAWVFGIWLIVFLFLMQGLSSFIMILATIVFSVFWVFYKQKTKTLFLLTSVLAGIIVIVALILTSWLYQNVTEIKPSQLDSLPDFTRQGNPYRHDLNNQRTENGHYVYVLISDSELSKGWEQISTMDYYGEDNRGQVLRYTLYRYMASLGLPRDSLGLTQLASNDIEAIEDGIPNYKYLSWPGIVIRLHQTIWEIHQYRIGTSIDGHTLNQRFEYWQAAVAAIWAKPLLGWGTGDLIVAMHYGLEKIDTRLAKEFWHKPHNQYLQFMVTFGIAGFLLIISLLVYAIIKTGSYKLYINNIFLVIVGASMLAEDTINNQVGLTFFVLFFCFFNFFYPLDEN